MNFCSECVYGKLVEERSGMYIYCVRPSTNKVPKDMHCRIGKLNTRKRLSAQACGNFVLKKDDFANR